MVTAIIPRLVEENPRWSTVPFTSEFTADYGHYASRADVLRQIGHDERIHKLESEHELQHPRFH